MALTTTYHMLSMAVQKVSNQVQHVTTFTIKCYPTRDLSEGLYQNVEAL